MCLRFRNGLVFALIGAILCNAYLIFMLWSGSLPDYPQTSKLLLAVETENLNKHTFKSVHGLNMTKLKSKIKAFVHKKGVNNVSPGIVRQIKFDLLPKQGISKSRLLKRVNKWVSSESLLPAEAPELGNLIHFLRTTPINKASVPKVGTQLKVMVYLMGGQKVLLKPQWYERNTEIEGEVYSGADRHNGEIVAFYLSLILNLRRTPVTVGRKISLLKEILPLADPDLADTFFRNNANQTCFYGVCRYCKPEMSVCGRGKNGDEIEAALVLWLPDSIKLKSNRSPWQRTYKKNVPALWENDDQFCVKLHNQSKLYQVNQKNRRLLDLIESSIFDFIISNGDRHHYEYIASLPNSAILLLDNGKSFGKANADYLDILAPLYQCCIVKKSTYDRLATVESGPLSALLVQLTQGDALYPLLTPEHLQAVDRRISIVMQIIELCAQARSWEEVLIR